jgi:hypothetical protein
MTTLTTTGAVLIVALTIGWIAGSLVLRIGGLLTTLTGLLACPTNPGGIALVPLGALAWLAGHWLFALRHHAYKSPLARRIYLQLLPARLDPTRRWAIPTTTTTHD